MCTTEEFKTLFLHFDRSINKSSIKHSISPSTVISIGLSICYCSTVIAMYVEKL